MRFRVAPSSENHPVAEHVIRVDLHCHSTCSDGELTPEALADRMHHTGAKYASLTDHDTIAGLDAFKQTLGEHGIGFVTGVEMTTLHHDSVIHLLGYGFDPNDTTLIARLADARLLEHPSAVGVATSWISSADAIALLHNAGGIAIMAHPVKTESDADVLLPIILELIDAGLDGIEAIYAHNTNEQAEMLFHWLDAYQLVTSAGNDSHTGSAPVGIDLDYHLWKKFRDALLASSRRRFDVRQKTGPFEPSNDKTKRVVSFVNMIFPAVLAMFLFVIALFGVLKPYFEASLMERKRESVRDVTKAALGVLQEAAYEVESNQMSLEKAQELAKKRIEAMRFGRSGDEYFWLQDLTPRILMHPYRPDLVNQDVSEFKDARNVNIFVEFVNVALEKEDGFVSYVWQWHEDQTRQEAKESYVRLFEEWNWIIGSGIYDKEVKEDIAKLEVYFLVVSLLIDLIIILLMFFLVGKGMKSDRAKRKAERLLNESFDRYRSLSEAATEGVLILTKSRCSYANAVMYELLGCREPQLQLLEVDDVFPDIPENEMWRAHLLQQDATLPKSEIHGIVKRADGRLIPCELSLKGKSAGMDGDTIVLVNHSIDGAATAKKTLEWKGLLLPPTSLATDITEAISRATQVEELVLISGQMKEMVQSLLVQAVSATEVSHLLSNIADVTTQRLIDMAIGELGPPPADFVFIGLGSHGREAVTLYSDQDNAIVYRQSNQWSDAETQAYFLALAEIVCNGLERAGYRKCSGLKMANQQKWCQPLPVWRKYIEIWVQCEHPEDIMEFIVFFDFRAVAGSDDIAKELRNHMTQVLAGTPPFMVQLAKDALLFTPPIRLFGNILIDGGKYHPGQLDVKAPNLSIVSFTRLYALKMGVQETNTIARLDAITRGGMLLDSTRRDIATAFEALLRIRLWNQVLSMQNDDDLSNWVNPSLLGHLDEVMLMESFKEIELLQKRILQDFFGGNSVI